MNRKTGKCLIVSLMAAMVFSMGWFVYADIPANPKIITDKELTANITDGQAISDKASGGTLTWGTFADPRTANPPIIRETTSIEAIIGRMIAAPLETGFDGNNQPALAESFELSPDGKTVTLKVRKGLKWSDGQPFTADDIIFSYVKVVFFPAINPGKDGVLNTQPSGDDVKAGNFILPGPNGVIDTKPAGDDKLGPFYNSRANETFSVTGDVTGFPKVTKVDDNTIRFEFSDILAGVTDDLTDNELCCMPEHKLGQVVENAVAKGDPTIFNSSWSVPDVIKDPTILAGTGPYVLTSLKIGAGGGSKFVRNPNYWKVDEKGNQLPKLNGMELVRVDDQNVELLAFLNGQLDALAPRPEDLAPIKARAQELKVRLFIGQAPGTAGQEFFTLNGDQPDREGLRVAFRDPEVRRAISNTMDRDTFGNVIGQGLRAPRLTGGHRGRADITTDACAVTSILKDAGKAFCDAYAKIVTDVSFDLAKANARLDAIGLKLNKDTGVRDIPAGFGFIVPGPNGVLDSKPAGDDVVLNSLVPGSVAQVAGTIQPGPNGVLDTKPAGDDVAVVTKTADSLKFETSTNTGNTIREQEERLWVDDAAKAGIKATPNDKDFVTLVNILLGSPPTYEVIRIGITGSFLIGQLQSVYGSCAGLHVNQVSDCDGLKGSGPDTRQPEQQEIDKIADKALKAVQTEDDVRLQAETQVLQAALTPWVFTTAGVPLGATRLDRIGNASTTPLGNGGPFNEDVLFRADIQKK